MSGKTRPGFKIVFPHKGFSLTSVDKKKFGKQGTNGIVEETAEREVNQGC